MIDEASVWYHTIDFPDGSSSPGQFDTRPAAETVEWPEALVGGRCLDVGTFDGFWSFEMERRGASQVIAIDLDDPEELDWSYDNRIAGPAGVRRRRTERGPGFRTALERLGSSVERVSRSVYDLSPESDGMFDVVLCGALLVHLRDPVLALERMRSVCRGQLVLVEAVDERLELLAPFWPVARFRPWVDQWWRLNSRGLETMLDVTGYRILERGPRTLMPLGPGASPAMKQSLVAGVAAGRPGRRGVLLRSFVAEPRPPADLDHH